MNGLCVSWPFAHKSLMRWVFPVWNYDLVANEHCLMGLYLILKFMLTYCE